MKKHKCGQGMVEYLILLAAVISILFIFAGKNGIFQKVVNKTVESGAYRMETVGQKIFN
ncbi:hypothetical protein MNBD_UNCLBAC01-529 [hydrothermal vent metagenome]|uniref:Class III signal peptide-containing protein n=1 Tax=hydrothermal vent metagenome TaxID=652676 RepID=A0A3B1E4G4_9ZZZZ